MKLVAPPDLEPLRDAKRTTTGSLCRVSFDSHLVRAVEGYIDPVGADAPRRVVMFGSHVFTDGSWSRPELAFDGIERLPPEDWPAIKRAVEFAITLYRQRFGES